MRDIILIASIPPPYGGVAIFNKSLIENFRNRNIQFRLFTSSEMGLTKKVSVFASVVLKMGRNVTLLDSCNMFLEYPYGHDSIFRGIIWNFFKIINGNRWIKIIHDGSLPDRYKEFSRFQKRFVNRSIKQIDEIVVVDSKLEQWLRTTVRYKKKVTRIGSALPLKYSENAQIPSEILAFIERNEKTILTIGTCNEVYGFQQVIQAIAELREKGMSIGLIAIDGNFNEVSEQYKKECTEIKKNGFVYLWEKGMAHETVLAIMKKCDLFVRGFFFESYGIARVEAILSGLPVVATNVGKTDGMYTYEPGDIQALKEGIENKLISQNKKEREYWKEKYELELESNLEGIMGVLNRICV